MDARKRRQDGGANGAFKKHKQEMDSSGIGSKSKPCTKFFSTSGCPFGESCHYQHHVPGGYKAVSPMMANIGQLPPMGPPMQGRYGGGPANAFSGGFGETATVKIGVDSALAGPIIGKGGVNSKQISRQTGVKLSIRDHESNPSLKNIELEGTFDQIKIATAMVRDLVSSLSGSAPAKGHGRGGGHRGHVPAHGPASNTYKRKLCENFAKGMCTFGDKCHFAHGASELRKS